MSECCCGSDVPVKLLYACSGAAKTGYLADNAAQRPAKLGIGKMTCLAAMGGRLSGFVESAKAAGGNLVFNGCSVACGKKIFENLGVPYNPFVMTDFGVEKEKTEITSELIAKTTFTPTEKIADE